MKRKFLLLLCMMATTMGALAQNFVVGGCVQEQKSKKPVEFASVALLRTDSTAVVASSTDEAGFFTLRPKEAGKYIVKVTYIGSTPLTSNVELTAEKDSIHLGTLLMTSTDNMLGTATVSATASRVEQKGDTTMFNAAAYRVPEGSTLENLVKQLPGVEVGDDGTIKWNGKTVSEFLINGKDFFKGDTKTAMKNLPTELVSKIKAYDKKSDYTEQTGIDDGEETTVLDIATKRQLNESWVTNVDLAYGNHDRYSGRFFASRFTDRTRVTAFGSANNTNDRGFGGPRGFGGGGSGLVATKNAGLDFSWENGRKKREAGRLELGGNVRYSHTSSDTQSKTNSETFLTSGTKNSFANSASHSIGSSTSVNSSFRLQWSPDSMTNITFRPSYSYSESHNSGQSKSATFNDDPYSIDGMFSPLDSIFAQSVAERNPLLYAMMVNTNSRLSLGDSKNHNVSGSLNAVRRLGTSGRNISLRLKAGYSKSESNSFAISNINYNPTSGRTGSFLNQYSTSPSKNWNYSARLGYVEPLGKNWFVETEYQFSYKYSDSNRSRYNLNELGNDPYSSMWGGQFAAYGDSINFPAIGSLPNIDGVLNYVRDLNNSQYATYKYYNHTATLGVRYNTKTTNFNADVDFNPERTRMAYNRPGQNIDTLITRNVFKVSPQMRYRYRFSQTNMLDIRYRGSSSQPSMTDLLAVVDDSNPLNISMGNPGLKPSWNNNLRIHYHGYNPTLQQGIMTGIDFSQTSNSISNRMVYDEATGVRYVRPDNINGNWNARGMFMFNSAIGSKKLFNVSTFTNVSYDNAVGYVSRFTTAGNTSATQSTYALLATPDASAATDHSYDYYSRIFDQAQASSQKNTTRTWAFDEHLRAAYRASWFDFGLLGRVNYQHARASVQDNANMDTWNFAYGADANVNLSFGLSLSTDIRMTSRRGYSDASMNTNELIWNAQIAQSFLKGKAATISVQFYDILHKQSNVSRTLSATQRTDSWNNAINSYFMVHFIYKLNIFAGNQKEKSTRDGERPTPPDMRGNGGMPGGRPMGPPPGGFGRYR